MPLFRITLESVFASIQTALSSAKYLTGLASVEEIDPVTKEVIEGIYAEDRRGEEHE